MAAEPAKTKRAPRTKSAKTPLQEAATAEAKLAKIDKALAGLRAKAGKIEKLEKEREAVLGGLSAGAKELLAGK